MAYHNSFEYWSVGKKVLKMEVFLLPPDGSVLILTFLHESPTWLKMEYIVNIFDI